jgi:hypothetical protein
VNAVAEPLVRVKSNEVRKSGTRVLHGLGDDEVVLGDVWILRRARIRASYFAVLKPFTSEA